MAQASRLTGIKGNGFAAFVLVWIGQVISVIGSQMSGFALGVWIYQRTGSATDLALTWALNVLPSIIASPVSGSLVDRWDRRWVMILGDLGAALSTLAIAVAYFSGHLAVWHILLTTTFRAAFSALQRPAFQTIVPALVPKPQLGRANGLVSLGGSAALIVSPMLAGVLLAGVGLGGIIVLDLATFLVAVSTVLGARIPRQEPSTEGKLRVSMFLQDVALGWSYLAAHRGLLYAFLLSAALDFVAGTTAVLQTPLVLAFSTPPVLGAIASAGGISMLAGSLLMTAWGGPKRKMNAFLGFIPLFSLGCLVAGLRASVPAIAVGSCCTLFVLPIVGSCAMAVMQCKVEPRVMGRVFAVGGILGGVTLTLSYLTGGALADRVFVPLLAANGPLAGSVGRVLGTGPGRGIGLMYVVAGIIILALAGIGYLSPRLRLLEDEMPDAAAGQASAGACG